MGHKSGRWIGCDVEEEYFGEDRKHGKMQRKMASAKDRSKYKKTDLDKWQKKQQQPADRRHELLHGRVLSITPQGISVDYENETIVCQLRGVLKKEKSQSKNLVTVGDFVYFEKNPDGSGAIEQVAPRRTILSRADNLSRRKEQLIASNIDQVIITASVVSPPLKPTLVDRYVIAAQKGGMQPLIVVNKIDLLQDTSIDKNTLEHECELYNDFVKAYEMAQIPVISASIVTGEGIEALRNAMKDKASVFSGQSGVGKSSLINAATGLTLRTGDVVGKTQKGSHTTTTANLLRLSFGGWCIDTPGIKSFGLWDLQKEDIEPYFVEIHAFGRECQFPNCTHIHEQGCAVKDAVEKGNIPLLRYESYIFLLASAEKEHLRR